MRVRRVGRGERYLADMMPNDTKMKGDTQSHMLTREQRGRFRNAVYQKTLRKVRDHFKPAADAFITDAMIRVAVDKVTEGISNLDLVMVRDHPEILCERCGECCRRCDPISIDDEDLAVIASTQGLSVSLAATVLTWTGQNGIMSLRTKPCPFLHGNVCSIYNHRPKVCRNFPLVPLPNGQMTLAHYSYCQLPINLAVEGAIVRLLMELLKRTHPRLASAMREEATKFEKQIEHLSQNEQIRLFSDYMKRFVASGGEGGSG